MHQVQRQPAVEVTDVHTINAQRHLGLVQVQLEVVSAQPRARAQRGLRAGRNAVDGIGRAGRGRVYDQAQTHQPGGLRAKAQRRRTHGVDRRGGRHRLKGFIGLAWRKPSQECIARGVTQRVGG